MPSRNTNELTNPQIATLAVYLLGGDRQAVDTEDIAVKANTLAPGRFTWRRYKDQINLELIRVYLSDAKKEGHGALLRGSGNEGWTLTARGLSFAKEAAERIDPQQLAQRAIKPTDRRRHARERERLVTSDAFAKWQAGRTNQISRREAGAFFRVDDYVVGEARRKKVDRVLTTFSDDGEVVKAARDIAEVLLHAQD